MICSWLHFSSAVRSTCKDPSKSTHLKFIHNQSNSNLHMGTGTAGTWARAGIADSGQRPLIFASRRSGGDIPLSGKQTGRLQIFPSAGRRAAAGRATRAPRGPARTPPPSPEILKLETENEERHKKRHNEWERNKHKHSQRVRERERDRIECVRFEN